MRAIPVLPAMCGALVAIIALGITIPAYGTEKPSPAEASAARAVIDGLTPLYGKGMALHRKYGAMDMQQLRACVQESRPLRAKAKAYMRQAKNLNWIDMRFRLSQAAQDAFVCVYCTPKSPPVLFQALSP